MRDTRSARQRIGEGVHLDATGTGEPAPEPYQESSELAQTYERAREAFVATQAAFQRVEQAHVDERGRGSEADEFYRRAADFRELVQLVRLEADREVDRFAKRRAALRPPR
jgi:hypothetical protein